MKDQIRTEEQIKKENRLREVEAYRKKYPERHKELQRIRSARWYHRHKEEIAAKKAANRPPRFCQWCGKNIDDLKPKQVRYCRPLHRKLYEKKRKQEWWKKKNGSLPPVSNV